MEYSDNEMSTFEVGKRYKVHNNIHGLIVVRKHNNELLVNMNGEELLKKIGNFVSSEFIWTDSWHVCMARKEMED